MTNETNFHVIFTGNIVAGFDIDKVKHKAAQMFRLDTHQIDNLFQSKAVTLKKNLSEPAAQKYQKVLVQIGMDVQIQTHKANNTVPLKTTSPHETNNKETTTEEPTTPNKPSPPQDWQIDEPGTPLSTPMQQQSMPAPETTLTIAPQQGHILHPEEEQATPPTPHLPGLHNLSICSTDETAPNTENMAAEAAIDTSHLSLAIPGENLHDEEEKNQTKVNIDTSAIRLSKDK